MEGITSGPLFEPWDGARQPFPVLEQGQEVVAQFGLVGRVGAEVRAPEALKPEGTGPPMGADVGGLGAVTEGYRHLADLIPQCLAVEKRLDRGPDLASAVVDLERARVSTAARRRRTVTR